MNTNKFGAPKILGKFRLSLVLAMVAILAISSVAIASIKSKNQTLDLQIATQAQQRVEIYRDLKVVLQNGQLNQNGLARDAEQGYLAKYDSQFWDELYSLLDQNADFEALSQHITNKFEDYEYTLLEQVLQEINDNANLDQHDALNRGKISLTIAFRVTAGVLAGYVAGKIVKLAALLIGVSSALGSVIGAIIGAVVVGLITYAVDRILRNCIEKYGQFVDMQWSEEVWSIAGWLIFFDLNVVLNLASIILNTFC